MWFCEQESFWSSVFHGLDPWFCFLAAFCVGVRTPTLSFSVRSHVPGLREFVGSAYNIGEQNSKSKLY